MVGLPMLEALRRIKRSPRLYGLVRVDTFENRTSIRDHDQRFQGYKISIERDASVSWQEVLSNVRRLEQSLRGKAQAIEGVKFLTEGEYSRLLEDIVTGKQLEIS